MLTLTLTFSVRVLHTSSLLSAGQETQHDACAESRRRPFHLQVREQGRQGPQLAPLRHPRSHQTRTVQFESKSSPERIDPE